MIHFSLFAHTHTHTRGIYKIDLEKVHRSANYEMTVSRFQNCFYQVTIYIMIHCFSTFWLGSSEYQESKCYLTYQKALYATRAQVLSLLSTPASYQRAPLKTADAACSSWFPSVHTGDLWESGFQLQLCLGLAVVGTQEAGNT